MQKIIQKMISVILIFALVLCSYTVRTSAATDSVTVNTIQFGSYPQEEVTDSTIISVLCNLDCEWQSYQYYSGTGIYDDGKMSQSDYMRFTDVEYNGIKYRGVVFDKYRPIFTGYTNTDSTESYQDNNGYSAGKTYWFKFDPLEWRVIDLETGYIVCESIIDSQPFENKLFFDGNAYFMDGQSYDFANYYVNSYIRKWLNSEFLDTAFTNDEKETVTINYMDDFWLDIYDKVFLPSANETKNTEYWKDDISKTTSGTDYAKCQGLFVSEEKSYWRLRSPSDWSQAACCVCTDGSIYGHNYYYRCYPYDTAFTGTGIRPAVKLGNINKLSLNISRRTININTDSKFEKMTAGEKIQSLAGGLTDIFKYFISPIDITNEDVSSVIDSLNRGINVPCMESGWAREWVLEKSTFENISSRGFDYIRLPTNLACILDDNGLLNEGAANNLDRVINYSLESGLTVILDMHGWEVLNGDPSAENIEALVSVWKQIAKRYKDFPEKLCFEILNEPSNVSGKMNDLRWNYIQNKVTSEIRKIDPDRIIVLSTMNYNAVSNLSHLRYNKRDPYIIIDVHNYAPFDFTHQGAEWVDGMDANVPYSAETSEAFAESIRIAADFQKKTGTKIIIGEFGAYLKQTTQEDINKFLSSAVKCMNENNLPWAYWEYYAGFGAYDCQTKQWKPFVIDALMSK